MKPGAFSMSLVLPRDTPKEDPLIIPQILCTLVAKEDVGAMVYPDHTNYSVEAVSSVLNSATTSAGNGNVIERDAQKTSSKEVEEVLIESLRSHYNSMGALLDEYNLQIDDWRSANLKQLLFLKRESAISKRKSVAAEGANKRIKI
jgi:hypothetical protein